ncbi:hypothetical protein DUI87_26474 [Hirundo rustica rustica]|uniref:CCHC-type domain-containing protein n=1 Tax=Hirundo rustica rustica TaxID=333673 RepID=A0A3M0J7F2_HIRRU|nr:hypothetical protein DUI87_26474 [Hirundo rustica rustica]
MIWGPNSRDLEALVDEAWRVFSNREEGYKQGMKRLVAVVGEGEKERCKQGPPKQGPSQLGKDQCAYCKKFGHWKTQCPELRRGDEQKKGNQRGEKHAICFNVVIALAAVAPGINMDVNTVLAWD